MNFDNNTVQFDPKEAVPVITFPPLSQQSSIRHGFSTRLGGVSNGIFSSMNLGYGIAPNQDDPANVRKNYEIIAKRIGVDPNSMVLSHQVHKTKIRLVDEKDMGKGLYRERDYDDVDGLITNIPGITLVTVYADCVPLYFVDTKNNAIGLSHSGWRGTVKKIGKITVEQMTRHFDSNPKDIIAVIGPSICGHCFEIGKEVADEFQKDFSNILFAKENGKYQCDLWEANKAVLIEAGLKPNQIHVSGICTACNSDLLFSHRKTQGKRGSLAAFLSIV